MRTVVSGSVPLSREDRDRSDVERIAQTMAKQAGIPNVPWQVFLPHADELIRNSVRWTSAAE